MERQFPGGKRLRLLLGDITRIPADAIVNAANSHLCGGGGVDGAIHRAGGPSLMRELGQIRARSGGCPTGGAVATSAGHLPARFVFHAVGPVYRDGGRREAELLASCHRTCLQMAEERDLRVVTFPAISTGVYGYPVAQAAPIALAAARAHLQRDDTRVQEIVFVLFDQRTFDAFARSLRDRPSTRTGTSSPRVSGPTP